MESEEEMGVEETDSFLFGGPVQRILRVIIKSLLLCDPKWPYNPSMELCDSSMQFIHYSNLHNQENHQNSANNLVSLERSIYTNQIFKCFRLFLEFLEFLLQHKSWHCWYHFSDIFLAKPQETSTLAVIDILSGLFIPLLDEISELGSGIHPLGLAIISGLAGYESIRSEVVWMRDTHFVCQVEMSRLKCTWPSSLGKSPNKRMGLANIEIHILYALLLIAYATPSHYM